MLSKVIYEPMNKQTTFCNKLWLILGQGIHPTPTIDVTRQTLQTRVSSMTWCGLIYQQVVKDRAYISYLLSSYTTKM